ncbi:hypothetical protein [Ornithinimicrobium cerasi]|uniref:Uncharacterized protein n=1 Tax=Ornithinimicrobium cerasi TaxID=2248773 RepID=A0A285VJJ2_9MICO|nr:hypothetical protein [Ornithinimicrobium cerasi]SOC54255.1 hypothetical protein SAMN05421879_10333 [Ornithinimicrobium cerasi]
MNALEDLIRRDLAATAQEITVDAEDRTHAEHRYLRRRQQLVRRRRSWTAVGAAAATALVVGGAAMAVQELVQPAEEVSPAGTAPEPEALPEPEPLPLTRGNVAGVWLAQVSPPEVPWVQGNGWLFEFRTNDELLALSPGDPSSGRSMQPQPYTLTSDGFRMPANLCDSDVSVDDFGNMVSTVVRVPEPQFRREGLQGHCPAPWASRRASSSCRRSRAAARR